MQYMLPFQVNGFTEKIKHTDHIFLIGSCFTEHISERLSQNGFNITSNPHGILFNPLSVASSLEGYVNEKIYTIEELFYLNELWNSWDHHTRFSNINQTITLDTINQSQKEAAAGIRKADWLIITLGTSYQYYLTSKDYAVSNNHRAPSQWFEKRMLTTEQIVEALKNSITSIKSVNPGIRIILTISPVRHIRDGVINNNRSKGRLIEAVHQLCELIDNTFYFPSYEIVIDILRDYRFYDIDFVHPNYLATSSVWEYFLEGCISKEAHPIMSMVAEIMTAYKHKTRFPETAAHLQFMNSYAEKCRNMISKYPYINLNDALKHFTLNK